MNIKLLSLLAIISLGAMHVLAKEQDLASRFGRFVAIKAGKYRIGSAEPRSYLPTHKKRRHIALGDYEIMDSAVTQEFYAKVMGLNPSRFQKAQHCPESFKEIKVEGAIITLCPDHPVEKVRFDDAQAFARFLSKQDNSYVYSLPTEDQLEVAFRAGTTGIHIGGDNEEKLGDYLWYAVNSQGKTHPAHSKLSNNFGIYRSGVWEWTQDYYFEKDSFDSHIIFPQDPTIYSFRAIRGGAFDCTVERCRLAYRAYGTPKDRYDNLGFRLVRTLRHH